MRLGDLTKLMAQLWPFAGGRGAVVADYAAIGAQHQHFLADIALRNNVMQDAPAGSDLELAIAEGRRRCAVEIITLCGVGYGELWSMIERKPRGEGT